MTLEEKLIAVRRDLFAFAITLTGNGHDAKDLVQDTMLKALRYRDRYDEAHAMGWLFLMQFRIFINNYRAKKNMRTIEINRRLPENIQSPIGHVNHLYLQRLVERFNEFRLYLYGYSYTEIAKHLHLPLGTVQNRIFNTRRELMKLYGERETA